MKKLFLLLMMLPFLVNAQTEEKIMEMTSFSVKQGHTAQFEDGVKKWKACYGENNGEGQWNMWKRVQGEGSVYGVTSMMDKWAEMDETDPAGKDCYAIVMNYIMPHVNSISNSMAMTLPDWSKSSEPTEEPKLVWVTYYDVKDDIVFRNIIGEVVGVMKAKEGDSRAYWYDVMGGDRDAADYMVSTLYGSYAELDKEKDSPYEMYVNAKGEKKAKELSGMWYKAVNDSWSYVWEYQAGLSK